MQRLKDGHYCGKDCLASGYSQGKLAAESQSHLALTAHQDVLRNIGHPSGFKSVPVHFKKIRVVVHLEDVLAVENKHLRASIDVT